MLLKAHDLKKKSQYCVRKSLIHIYFVISSFKNMNYCNVKPAIFSPRPAIKYNRHVRQRHHFSKINRRPAVCQNRHIRRWYKPDEILKWIVLMWLLLDEKIRYTRRFHMFFFITVYDENIVRSELKLWNTCQSYFSAEHV